MPSVNELKYRFRQAPATYTIILICIVIYLLIHSGIQSLSVIESGILFGAYYKAFIAAGEWWRMFTVGFVHMRIGHLFMNMYSLYVVGPFLERQLGRRNFLILLFGSVLGGSLMEFMVTGNTVAVGLSGGLYGCMAAFALIVYKSGGFSVPQFRNMILRMFAINLLINFMPNIAWQAHVGGLVFGGLISELMIPSLNKSLKKNTAVALVILTIFCGIFCVKNRKIAENEMYLQTDFNILVAEKGMGFGSYAEHMAKNLDNLYDITFLEPWLKGVN